MRRLRKNKFTQRVTFGLNQTLILSAILLWFSSHTFGKSREAIKDSLILSTYTQNDTFNILVYKEISELYFNTDYDTAQIYANKAIKLGERLKFDELKVSLYHMKCALYIKQQRYVRAIDYYKRAIEIANKYKDQFMVFRSLFGIAVVHEKRGYYQRAFRFYLMALEKCDKRIYPKYYVQTLTSLGNLHVVQKKYKTAASYFEQAFTLSQTENDSVLIATSLNYLGSTHMKLNNYENVLDYFNRAYEIAEKMNDIGGQAFPLYSMSLVYFEKKDYEKASYYANKSLEFAKKINNKKVITRALNILGRIYSKKGEYKYALVLFKKASDIATELDDKVELSSIYKNISENYEKFGDFEQALIYYKLNMQVNENLFSIESSRKMAEIQGRYIFQENEKKLKIKETEIQERSKQHTIQIVTFVLGILFLLLTIVVIWRNSKIKTKANRILYKQHQRIREQHLDIKSSLRYAQLIQSAAMPPQEYMKRILPEHFILFLPRDIVSGDFYWATQKEGKTIIACADCTGHGVPGAFMSMLGISFLTEIVNRSTKIQADLVLNRLRNNIIESLHQTKEIGATKDGMDISLCILNEDHTELEYAGALMSIIIVREGKIERIRSDNMPIGSYVTDYKSFTKHKVPLKEGDMVYMFSDGYNDQFGGPKNKKFKMHQFTALITANCHKHVLLQKEVFHNAIMDWKGDHEQVDDILVIGFQV